MPNPNCDRQSARNVLEDQVKRLTKKMRALRILLSSIDWDKLCKEDEEFLWCLFTGGFFDSR